MPSRAIEPCAFVMHAARVSASSRQGRTTDSSQWDSFVGVAFSPRDPNLLALAQHDGPVTLWDLARRVRVGNPLDVVGEGAERRLVAGAATDRTLGRQLLDVAHHGLKALVGLVSHAIGVGGEPLQSAR
jgi:hypothetical protein